MEEIIVNSERANVKYINKYIRKDDYYELHITDGVYVDNIYKIDIDDIDLMTKHFWCQIFIGKNGHKRPKLYYNHNKTKHYLNELLINDGKTGKIIFKNRDCTDYRKNNLYRVEKGQFEFRTRQKSGKSLPTNIYCMYNRDKTVRGYSVRFKESLNEKEMWFSVTKYGSSELALSKAIEYREYIVKKYTEAS